MSASRGRELLLEAIQRGYTVDQDGNAFGPSGRRLLRKAGSGYCAIALKIEGRVMNVEVHRIAAYQLYGEAIFQEGIDEVEIALCNDRQEGMEFRDLAVKYQVSVGAAHYIFHKKRMSVLKET